MDALQAERIKEAEKLLNLPPFPVANPTQSFWQRLEGWNSPIDLDALKSTSLKVDSPYSVVIIGAGLTGISVAYWLTEHGTPGSSILVIDTRDLAGGATGRNGGHCWPSTRVFEEEEIEKWGKENLEKAEEWKFRGAAEFMKFILDENIDCDFYKNGSCNLAKWDEEMKEYEQYLESKKERQSVLDCTFSMIGEGECEKKFGGNVWKGGLFQSLGGQFWAKKCVIGIASIVQKRGVSIRTHTMAKAKQTNSNGFLEILLESLEFGEELVSCTHIVHATNGYAASLLPQLKGILVPVRGQVVATNRIRTKQSIPFNLSLNDGYEYLIQRISDLRIIYGGMRWKSELPGKEVGIFDDSKIDEKIAQSLRFSLDFLFPFLGDDSNLNIEHNWTGIMGFSCDSKPLIGKLGTVDSESKEWIAGGYCGNGMPQCFAAAKYLSSVIHGKLTSEDRDWIPQFDPNRFDDAGYRAKFQYTGKDPLEIDD